MEHGSHAAAEAPAAKSLAGLALGDGVHRMVLVEAPTFARGYGEHHLAFQILRADGEPETDYDEVHERLMHVIVIRRDLTEFQHVHPKLTKGIWRTEIEVPTAGSWRVFADFSSSGSQKTLGVDLQVPGDFQPAPFPASSEAWTWAITSFAERPMGPG